MSKFVIQQDVAIGLGNGFVVTDTLTDKLTSGHTLMFTRQMIETLALVSHIGHEDPKYLETIKDKRLDEDIIFDNLTWTQETIGKLICKM